tara:strand:- start:2408 stop:3412 length:1005 start_codon:yes stop_codon:yes gene_type:complete
MTYIIAEIGNNHNGNVEKCLKLFDAAAKAGASAVKIQSFTGRDIISPNIKSNLYPSWDSKGFEYWYEFLDSIALPLKDHQTVIDFANELGMDFITTPVTPDIVEYLEKLNGIKGYKLASMDLTNIDLVQSLAQTNKSIIISTGMGDLNEIDDAVSILKKNDLSILHCISDYPLNPNNAAINNIKVLKNKFDKYKVGFSDHSLGFELAIIAITLGAEIIEKHFTLNRNDKNSAEHHFSMEPKEFESLVNWAKILENNFKVAGWDRSKKEESNKIQFRRSFHYKKNLLKDHIITREDLIFIRPGNGLNFDNIDKILNQKLTSDKKAYTACYLDDIK